MILFDVPYALWEELIDFIRSKLTPGHFSLCELFLFFLWVGYVVPQLEVRGVTSETLYKRQGPAVCVVTCEMPASGCADEAQLELMLRRELWCEVQAWDMASSACTLSCPEDIIYRANAHVTLSECHCNRYTLSYQVTFATK